MIGPLPTHHLVALALASLFLASPGVAKDDGGGKPDKEWSKAEKHADKDLKKAQKHADKEWKKNNKQADKREREEIRIGTFFSDKHRAYARAYYIEQYGDGRRCPAGLAKNNHVCVAPAQVHYIVGQPLPRTVTVYQVAQPVIVQLPVAPLGYRYVRVGNDILLVSAQSQMVIDVIAGLLG